MTKRRKKLIFYGLTILFFIAAPATILYSTGYAFDWEKKQIIKTGGFYFKSSPKKAQIFLDGKKNGATPKLIDHLLPRRYAVEIIKDGFYPWKKNLEIKPDLSVTEARNILLVPKEPKITLVAENSTSSIKDYFTTTEQKEINDFFLNNASSTLREAASWVASGNDVYFLEKTNLVLYRINRLDLSSKNQISFEPLPAPKNNYEILVSDNKIAVFEPGGKLFLFNEQTKTFQLLSEAVIGAYFSPDNKKLVFWNDQEIWATWLEDDLILANKKSNEKELITRYSNKIKQAVWLPDSEHIIFLVVKENDIDSIKMTELDSRDQRNTYDIFSDKNCEIYFNQKDKLLYIKTQNIIYSLDLLIAS